MPKIPDMPLPGSEPEDYTPQSARESGLPAVSLVSVYDHAELKDEAAEYWLNMDGWTAYETALLLFALDPNKISILERGGKSFLDGLAWPQRMPLLEMLIQRAGATGALSFPAPPGLVLAWADRMNLSMPAQFVAHRQDQPPSTGGRQAVSRAASHQAAILEKIRSLGYDPKALPKPPKGKANPIKQQVKAALGAGSHPIGPEAFRKAWQELLNSGDIVQV